MDTSDRTATNLKQGITSTNIAATLFNEEKEKEKRQLNLILHNNKESNDQITPNEKRKMLVLQLQYLGISYVDRVPVSINGCFRIGKKRDDPNKPHLIKITVNSLGEKVAVLQNQDNPEQLYSQGLHNTKPNTYSYTEQKTNKKLRSQLTEMNKIANLIAKTKTGKLYNRKSKGSHFRPSRRLNL